MHSDIKIPTIFPILNMFAAMGAKKIKSKNDPKINKNPLKILFIIPPLFIVNNGNYKIIDGM